MVISPSACNIGRSCARLVLEFRSNDRELILHHNLTQYDTQRKPREPREHLHAFERTDEDQTGKLEDVKDHVNKSTSLSYPEQKL
jgi:LAS superfamily LD-carboxypeptidase LdcB